MRLRRRERSAVFRRVMLAVLLIPAVAAGVVTMWFSAAAPAHAVDKPVLKVGFILALSGGLEQWCGYIRQGAALAASEDGSVAVELKFEDDGSVEKKAALSAAQKLVQIDKVDVLLSWTPSTVAVLAPVVKNAGVPLITVGYNRQVAQAGVMGAFVNYDLLPRQIARFFAGRGLRRFAVVVASDDWSTQFEDAFRDEASKLGGQVAFSAVISPQEKDTRSLIVRLKQERIDAVLAPLYAGSLYSFLREAHAFKFAGAISVADGMFEEDIRIAGASAEGVFATQTWLNSPTLASQVHQRSGSSANPLQLGLVAVGYEAVRHARLAAAQIVASGGKISPRQLSETLSHFESYGYLGKQMFGAAPTTSGERVVVVREGRFALID